MRASSDVDNLLRTSRFLVVDDHLSWIELMRAVLLAWGVTSVLGAESAEKAERIIETHKIDMIFCDLNMPGGDGLSLLRWLRRHEDGSIRRLPFALMTSETTEINITRAACCGADLVIEKPLKPGVLWPRMLNILSRRAWDERAAPPCGKVLLEPCPLIPLAWNRRRRKGAVAPAQTSGLEPQPLNVPGSSATAFEPPMAANVSDAGQVDDGASGFPKSA